MKYRKKPVVIDALELRFDNWIEMCKFAGVGHVADGKPQGCFIDEHGNILADGGPEHQIGMHIPTLEGLMLARQGDYIIRGVNGEFYPCKPDIFEKTYDPVAEGP